MSQLAAKRRRRQHALGFAHLAKPQRPKYKRRSLQAAVQHEDWVRRRERDRVARGGSKK